ncbi:MAG: chalcone isomerase family protein [Rubrivivax sp.]|nr:chalcone isomerase family protein [Rubrivivax sp.]
MIRFILPTLVLLWATAAQALDVAGVNYPPQFTVAGKPLVLNGAGIRYRFVVKVYTAGLYLPAKADSVEQALALPGPKRIHIQMLRDIDANTLGKLFTRGMEDNSSRAEFGKAIPGTLKLSELFVAKKKLASGENFSVEYIPGQGTMVLVNGQPGLSAPIMEPEFFQSLLKIWLGPKPADDLLKSALLGKDAQSPQGN